MIKFNEVSRKTFIRNFGYYTKIVSLEEIPELIHHAILINDSYINQKIKADINFYIRKCRRDKLGILIAELCSNEDFVDIVYKNINEIKKKISFENVEICLRELIKIKKYGSLIYKNMALFLENANTKLLTDKLINILNSNDLCAKKIDNVKKNIEKIEYNFIKSINFGTLINIFDFNLLDEIINIFRYYSYDNLENVSFLNRGGTASVFLIKNQRKNIVIKIGKKRENFSCPSSSYYLQPYLRKEYKINNIVICTVEVQDYCTTEFITEKDVEKLYENLKNEHIIWIDKKKENVFKLNYPNVKKIFSLDAGLLNNRFEVEKILQPNDIILGDIDWVFSIQQYRKRHRNFNVVTYKNKISILIQDNSKVSKKQIKQLINLILNQTFNEYIVYFSLKNMEKIINNFSKIDNRIKIYKNNKDFDIKYCSVIESILLFKNPYFLRSKGDNL